MTQRDNPTLSCTDAGQVIAAMSSNPTLHVVCGCVNRRHLVKPSRKNRRTYAVCSYAIAGHVDQSLQR